MNFRKGSRRLADVVSLGSFISFIFYAIYIELLRPIPFKELGDAPDRTFLLILSLAVLFGLGITWMYFWRFLAFLISWTIEGFKS